MGAAGESNAPNISSVAGVDGPESKAFSSKFADKEDGMQLWTCMQARGCAQAPGVLHCTTPPPGPEFGGLISGVERSEGVVVIITGG